VYDGLLMDDIKLILVTGATGYTGGKLVPRLLEQGYEVRVLVRESRKLRHCEWVGRVQVMVGDVLERATLEPALATADAAYYLVHSMTGGTDFAEQDLIAARNFGEVAKHAGVKRVVYLGGLGDTNAQLSKHLRSRHETGEELRQSGVSVTEFRAAIIVGTGSISFEMIRYLAERVPIMICPTWVRTRVQPIAIDDVIPYLVEALQNPESANQIIEIGGSDVSTYGDMMKGYARLRGLHRWLLNVPVLTPRLSSYWVHWVTPISAAYARPLVEGLRNEVIVRDNKALELFPEIRPSDYSNAVSQTLSQLHPGSFKRRSAEIEEDQQYAYSQDVQNGLIVEIRERLIDSPPETVYQAFTELGGTNGWPCNMAWRLRAAMDRILGGIGMRKGCPESGSVHSGDTIDFFRVLEVEPNRMIRLKAEMKLPGDGWLQFEARPLREARTRLVLTVFFAPKGLLGLAYWHLVKPFHILVFARMISRLAGKVKMM